MKSPGGSEFPYYYKGGEIHCLKYGSMYKDHEKLLALMRLEEDFISQFNQKLRIWIDLYKTSTPPNVLQELMRNLENLQDRVIKISFVGLNGISRWRLKRMIRQKKIRYPISFYSDPEDAKTWLIHEHY